MIRPFPVRRRWLLQAEIELVLCSNTRVRCDEYQQVTGHFSRTLPLSTRLFEVVEAVSPIVCRNSVSLQ